MPFRPSFSLPFHGLQRRNHHLCRSVPTSPVYIVSAGYGAGGKFRFSVSSGGRKFRSYPLSLPDEGVYLVYGNRALQVAALPCENRKCCNSPICRCDTRTPGLTSTTQNGLGQNQNQAPYIKSVLTRKPCCNCLSNWLELYQASQAADRLGMQFLYHPKTLTWANLLDHQAYHYDSMLVEEKRHARWSRNGIRPRSSPSGDSSYIIDWMREAWTEFADKECCSAGNFMPLSKDRDCGDGNSDIDDASDHEGRRAVEKDDSSDNDTDSGWDVVDIPCEIKTEVKTTQTASSPQEPSKCDSDEYDLIEDLIEVEFPKLRKTIDTVVDAKPGAISLSSPSKMEPSSVPTDSTLDDDNDAPPVPVITPPKDMTMARELERPATTRESLASSLLSHASIQEEEEEEEGPELAPELEWCELSSSSPTEKALRRTLSQSWSIVAHPQPAYLSWHQDSYLSASAHLPTTWLFV
ncbi:hypothetical protein AAE478_003890 [Parahypoxylon ruwenzoriense]